MLRTDIDPFTVEIIRSGVVATTEEMKTNLMKTSYNPIVYESEDFTVALTDGQGNLVSIGLGLPSFIRGISEVVKGFVRHFGDDIQPGDILLSNDAYAHGSHLNHMIMALPVFAEDEIVAFSCSEPHWADIGGVLQGRTTDIYSEGLQLPPLKIYKQGVLDRELASIIQLNVRNPELAMGDFRGQIACMKTGEKRIAHMAQKYGKDVFVNSIKTIMDKSEQFSRRQLRAIPEGTYEAEQFLDDDGVDVGVHMRVKVKVTVKGDTMTVDLSEMGKQVRGPYNSAAGVSGAQMGFKHLVCPQERPVNDGSFRPLKVILPPGTFVSAQRPAAFRSWMIPTMNIADTMWKAMAPAMPDKVMAGHFGTLPGGSGGGLFIDPRSGRPVLGRGGVGGRGGGGYGAKYNEDGMCATHCISDGDTHNHPIESGEAHNQHGLCVRLELWQDSGGAGKFRGGMGTVDETLYFYDSMIMSYVERSMCPPWGAFGAKPGLACRISVGQNRKKLTEGEAKDPRVLGLQLEWEHFPNPSHPNAKISNMHIVGGSRVINMSGGGGGFGNPLQRDLWRVHEDVVNGYVSLESALNDYGVIIDPRTLEVDEKKTEERRKRLSSA